MISLLSRCAYSATSSIKRAGNISLENRFILHMDNFTADTSMISHPWTNTYGNIPAQSP